ncbi:MAG: fibronectin type III domain-containing protein [Chitinophagales bacterium]|nr:fibronectin type III domain-containing protein [Chitinophagales bacterium]
MKKIFLLITCVCLYSFSWAALTTITTQKIKGTPLCGGEMVDVSYTVDAPAKSGNVFTAQLSDKSGKFGSPVDIGSIAGTTSGTITATIPMNTNTGSKYQIRVVSSNPSVIGTPSPNSFKINPSPKDLTVTNITACSATLNWSSVSTATSYDVRYKKTNGGSFSSAVNTTGLGYTFTGLQSSTSYEFDVRAKCPTGSNSSYSAATASTIACPVPGNLFVSVIGTTTSDLDWPDATCAMDYSFRYRATNTSTWTYKHPTVSTIHLTGLLPAQDYEAQVATRCSSSDSSTYGNTATWQTMYFRLAGNSDGSYLVVYPNLSNGAFSLNFNNSNGNSKMDIYVQNVFGQIVYHETKSIVSGLNKESIKLDNIASGMYFVKIVSLNEEYNSSIIIK